MERSRALAVFAMAVGCALAPAACKSNEVNQTSNTTNNFTSIDARGGTVLGPEGTSVRIPADALDAEVEVGITEAKAGEYPETKYGSGVGTGAPPVYWTLTGKVWAFLPHGLQFFIEPTFKIPAPPGNYFVMKAQPGGEWANIGNATSVGGFVQFKSSSFSFYAVTPGTGMDDGGTRDAVDPCSSCRADCDSKCGANPSCVSDCQATNCAAACGTGSDAGPLPDATASDTGGGPGGDSGGSLCPTTTQPADGTGNFSTLTVRDGYAFYKPDNMLGADYYSQLWIVLTDKAGICTRSVSRQGSASSRTLRLRLEAKATTSAFTFTAGTYADGTTYGVSAMVEQMSATCLHEGTPESYGGGTVIITSTAGGRYQGSFSFPAMPPTSATSGTFDLSVCPADNSSDPGGPGCCK